MMKLKNKGTYITLKFLNIYFVLITLIMLIGCSKQESTDLPSEEVRGTREIERMEACSKVNFTKGVLLYQNMLDLFICTKWDEQYPNMYNSIKKITAASWDHLVAPIDQSFIENQQRRDRVFRNIRELDSKNGLDDLSYVLTALTNNNFFDATKDLFICVENPLNPVCLLHAGRIPEKKSLKNIIKLVDVSPESIDNVSQLLKQLIISLGERQEDLRAEVNKIKTSSSFGVSRLEFVDALAVKAKAGFSEEDREFISKVFLTGNASGDHSWIYEWIQDLKMNREKFKDLLEYPILTNPEFVGEIKNLEKAYDGGVECSIKDPSSPNNQIEFDFKTHLSEYVGVIKDKDYKRFYDYSSADIFGLKLSTEVCKELENNKYNANFIKIITHLSDFFGEKKFYDLVKFLISQSTASGDPEKTFAENLYLFDMITGDIFSSANAINASIINKTRSFYPIIFDVIKNIPPDSYLTLGELAEAFWKPENDSRQKAVGDYWNFFNSEQKNFLFNFVDYHFDKQTNYVLLLDFYSKFLDDFKEVQPLFKDKWMGSVDLEERSYLSLQDVFSNFSGVGTLLEFKKFFSRDQILRVLQVISNGPNINKLALEELQYIKSDNYVIRARSERYKFKVNYHAGMDIDYNSKPVIECMQKFADLQNGIYELIRNLPAECSKVANDNIAFRLYGWLNTIEQNYLEFKQASEYKDSLLDKFGILSPSMVNTTIGVTKIIDNLLGPIGSTVPTKNGFNYLFSSAKYYLNEKSAAPLIDKNLAWLNSFFDVLPAENTLHRNSLVKSFTREDNFSYSKNLFNNLGSLFQDYGSWIKSGEWEKAQNRSLGIYDPNQDCVKVINQFVSPYPCPVKETVKFFGNDILFLLQNVWEKDKGNPISLLLKSLKPGEGLDIPLNSKKPRKYRLSLKETFRFLYDSSDRSLDINNIKVKFVNEANKTMVQNLTTLERVETVIREVRFDNNYLGVAFLNAVVNGENYNSTVKERGKLLDICLKIPVVRCGRTMSDNDLRMARNASVVTDSLLDINNGRGRESRLKYGDYLKTFETALVGSSAAAAQKSVLLPLPNDVLLKHNGKILRDMTVISLPSHMARAIRDRVGRTRSEFDAFVNSEAFKRVDRSLLYGFDLPTTYVSATELVKKISSIPAGEKQNLFDKTVDWVSTLNYNETRLLEDTISRALVVGSFLGTPEIVFNFGGNDLLATKYANNNLFQIFIAMEKIIDYWPTLTNYFPGNVRLIDVVKPINTALYFLTNKLNSESDPAKNTAYLALNDLFLVLQTTVFDKVPSAEIGAAPEKSTQGLELLLAVFKKPKLVEDFYSIVADDYKYLDIFHQNNGEWFSSVGQNVKRLTQSNLVVLAPIRDYLSYTSKNLVCLSNQADCKANYHYDEAANLIRFLNKKSESGQSNFMLMNQKVLVENFDQISQMINDLLPAIKIKEIKPPLNLN